MNCAYGAPGSSREVIKPLNIASAFPGLLPGMPSSLKAFELRVVRVGWKRPFGQFRPTLTRALSCCLWPRSIWLGIITSLQPWKTDRPKYSSGSLKSYQSTRWWIACLYTGLHSEKSDNWNNKGIRSEERTEGRAWSKTEHRCKGCICVRNLE